MRTPTLSLLLALLAAPAAAQERLPILDVHLHAVPADHLGPPPVAMCTPMPYPAWDPSRPYGELFGELARTPPCPDPVWSPMTDEALMNETIEVMERLNIVGVLSGEEPERIARWMAAAPGRFIPGLVLGFGPAGAGFSTDSLRSLHAAGRLAVLGEVINQYAGIAPDEERMAAYWALAEELDIPVGIHVGPGPPGAVHLGASGYRARLHSPLTMEEVLVRHPRLRVYLMHAGYPMLDDLLAVLYAHPQVHVDVGIIVFQQPRAEFYRYLRTIVEAGFGDRVMFGSDQIVWPGVIERAIAVIEEAPFLTEAQKRDILFNNAARFLRLSEEEIARHHGRAEPRGHDYVGRSPFRGAVATNRRSSMVMTMLEARVAPERWEALRASYAERACLSEEVPVVESFLVQADDDPDTWRIVTVWRDRESLEAMRASGETPTGVLIFRDADAEPRLSIFTVFANPRATAGSRP